jgi:hypothetical protein
MKKIINQNKPVLGLDFLGDFFFLSSSSSSLVSPSSFFGSTGAATS